MKYNSVDSLLCSMRKCLTGSKLKITLVEWTKVLMLFMAGLFSHKIQFTANTRSEQRQIIWERAKMIYSISFIVQVISQVRSKSVTLEAHKRLQCNFERPHGEREREFSLSLLHSLLWPSCRNDFCMKYNSSVYYNWNVEYSFKINLFSQERGEASAMET